MPPATARRPDGEGVARGLGRGCADLPERAEQIERREGAEGVLEVGDGDDGLWQHFAIVRPRFVIAVG